MLRILLVVWILLGLSCQHSISLSGNPEPLDKVGVRAYLTQSFPRSLWSSKARIHSLGGRRAPPPPLKVQALDIRDLEMSKEDHWKEDKRIRTKIIQLPWRNLLQENLEPALTLDRTLGDVGLEKNEIVLVLSDSVERTKAFAMILFKKGFWQVKYASFYYQGSKEVLTDN